MRPSAGTFGTRGSELGLFPADPVPDDPVTMNASFRHTSVGRADGAAGLLDAAAPHGPAASPADQACCCVARAVVRVLSSMNAASRS